METEKQKNRLSEMIYMDNCGTTFMSDTSKQKLYDFLDQGNPSGDYKLAKKSNSKINHLKK